MKNFIKQNIVLAVGISLPLLLVALFILASILPAYFVEAPRYDVVFSDGRYSYVNFEVQQQKLHMKIDPAIYLNEKSLPRLYRYAAATGTVQEITYQAPDMSAYGNLQKTQSGNDISANIVITVDPTKPPTDAQAKDTSAVVSQMKKEVNTTPFTIPVPEASSLILDASVNAPDGYQFIVASDNYDASFLLGGGNVYVNNAVTLRKNGRVVLINFQLGQQVYAGVPRFIAWVLP
jgi:hypothetical protein